MRLFTTFATWPHVKERSNQPDGATEVQEMLILCFVMLIVTDSLI